MTTGLTVGLEADPDSASQSEKLPDRALMVYVYSMKGYTVQYHDLL